VLGAIFVVSRVAYLSAGVVFDDTPLTIYWQYLPVSVLQSDLLRGLLALHSQPPLFNFFLGVGLKTSAPSLFYEVSFKCAAFALVVAMFYVLRGCRVHRSLAHFAALTFLINPVLVLYESWLFYTVFEATLLMIAVAGLTAWDRAPRDSLKPLVLFAIATSALVGLRSVFHPIWAAVILLGLIGCRRRRGCQRAPRALALLAAPLAIGLVLCAKNAWLIGYFTTSSWTGMNLSRIALHDANPRELDALIAKGRLSPLSRSGGFLPLEAYEPYRREIDQKGQVSPMAEHPALSLRHKPVSNEPNFNHLQYVVIAELLKRDSLAFIRANPRHYGANVLTSLARFDDPAANYALLETNRVRVRRLIAVAQSIVYPSGSPVLVWLAVVITVIGGALSGSRARHESAPTAGLFAAITVLWLVTANLVEFGENNRFRVAIDPLLYTAVFVVASQVWVASRDSPPQVPRA
jgi:hypothetical protein